MNKRIFTFICPLLILICLVMHQGCDTPLSLSSGRNKTSDTENARKLINANQLDKARVQLNEIIRKSPSNSVAFCLLGEVERKSHNYEKAEREYRTACNLDRNNPLYQYNLGLTLQIIANQSTNQSQKTTCLNEAVQAYLIAIASSDNEKMSFDANLNLGGCYFHLGKHRLAEQATKSALNINPRSYSALSNLGRIYMAMNSPAKASTLFLQSLEINPKQVEVLLNLGKMHMALKEYDRAIVCFNKVIAYESTNSEASTQLGICYFRTQKPDEAIAAFQIALRAMSENVDALRGLGVVCMYQYELDKNRTDLRDKALKAWKHAIKLQPGHEDLKRLIARYESLKSD